MRGATRRLPSGARSSPCPCFKPSLWSRKPSPPSSYCAPSSSSSRRDRSGRSVDVDGVGGRSACRPRGNGNDELPLGSIAWRVAERGRLLDGATGDLPRRIYNTVQRAVRGLEESAHRSPMTTSREERVATLDELVDGIGPHEGRDDPETSAGAAAARGRLAQDQTMSTTESELLVLDALSDDARTMINEAWRRAEGRARRATAVVGRIGANTAVLHLLVRGRDIVQPSKEIAATVTLVHAIDRVRAMKACPEDLARRLDALMSVLPRRAIERALLKSMLRRVARIKQYRTAVITDEFKSFAARMAPDVMQPFVSKRPTRGSRRLHLSRFADARQGPAARRLWQAAAIPPRSVTTGGKVVGALP